MMRGDISKGESNYTSDITKTQLRQMYELGAKSLVTKPGVTKIGTRGLSKFQAEQVFILSERAKKLKTNCM